MAEALNEALHEEMGRDPGVFVIGEDIASDRRAVPGHRRPARAVRARSG